MDLDGLGSVRKIAYLGGQRLGPRDDYHRASQRNQLSEKLRRREWRECRE